MRHKLKLTIETVLVVLASLAAMLQNSRGVESWNEVGRKQLSTVHGVFSSTCGWTGGQISQRDGFCGMVGDLDDLRPDRLFARQVEETAGKRRVFCSYFATKLGR